MCNVSRADSRGGGRKIRFNSLTPNIAELYATGPCTYKIMCSKCGDECACTLLFCGLRFDAFSGLSGFYLALILYGNHARLKSCNRARCALSLSSLAQIICSRPRRSYIFYRAVRPPLYCSSWLSRWWWLLLLNPPPNDVYNV